MELLHAHQLLGTLCCSCCGRQHQTAEGTAVAAGCAAALVCIKQHGGSAWLPYAAVYQWASCPWLPHAALALSLAPPAVLDALSGLQQVALK